MYKCEVWVTVAKMWGVSHFAWESSIQSFSPIPTLHTALLTHKVEHWNSPVSHTGDMQSTFIWDLDVPIFTYVSKQDQFKTERAVNVRCADKYEVWVVTCKVCVLDVTREIHIGWLSVNLRLRSAQQPDISEAIGRSPATLSTETTTWNPARPCPNLHWTQPVPVHRGVAQPWIVGHRRSNKGVKLFIRTAVLD